jgi:UDP-N-acetylglucosamine 3-dehydrogenase
VYAKGIKKVTNYEDYASILLEFEDGILGNIEVNRLTPTKIRTLSLTCTDGFAEIDYIKQEISRYEKMHDTDYENYDELRSKSPTREKLPELAIKHQEPLKLELDHFIECIKNNKKPLVDGIEGLTNLKVAIRALESINSKDLETK